MSTRPTRAQSLLYNRRPAAPTRIRASSAAAMVGELSASLDELRSTADVSGLLRIQAMALAITEVTTDPAIVKKAQRIAKKAGAHAVRLQRRGPQPLDNGVLPAPPGTDQQAPQDGAIRNGAAHGSARNGAARNGAAQNGAAQNGAARNGATPPTPVKLATGATTDLPDRGEGPISIDSQLSSRLLSLLELLLAPGQPTPTRAATLRALAEDDAGGGHPVELPTLVRSWLPLLLNGYEQGRRLSSAVPLGVVKHRHEQQIERELRDTAAQLIAGGADPRGLTADAVPLVAYSLVAETLPTAIDPASAEAADKVNVLLLTMADGVSSIPTTRRRLFVELLKLAVVLGEAQAFADQLKLNRLSLDQGRPSAGTSSYMIGIGLLVGGVAVIGLLVGLGIGTAGTNSKAAVRGRTVTRTEIVTHTRTIEHGRTTTVTAPQVASPQPGKSSGTRTVTVTVRPPAAVAATRTVTVTTRPPAALAATRTVTVTTRPPAAVAPTQTVTVTRKPRAVAPTQTVTVTRKVGNPTVRTVRVVPPACATAIDKARSLTAMAVGDLNLITEYAQLASQAIPAAARSDTAAIERITTRIQAIDNTLSRRATEIAQVGKEFGAGAAQCS